VALPRYVIDSFNADKPYNRFVTEQIAGDLLPFTTPEQRRQQLVATAFPSSARPITRSRTRTCSKWT